MTIDPSPLSPQTTPYRPFVPAHARVHPAQPLSRHDLDARPYARKDRLADIGRHAPDQVEAAEVHQDIWHVAGCVVARLSRLVREQGGVHRASAAGYAGHCWLRPGKKYS